MNRESLGGNPCRRPLHMLTAFHKLPQNLEDFKLVNRPPRGLVGEYLARHVSCECDALIDLSAKL